MKLTNGEIFNAKEPLEALMKEKMPIKTAFELAAMAVKLNDPLRVIGQIRQGLFETYGEDVPNTHGQKWINPENGDSAQKFTLESAELMAQEVDVDIAKVKLPDTLEIAPAIVMALEKFVTIS